MAEAPEDETDERIREALRNGTTGTGRNAALAFAYQLEVSGFYDSKGDDTEELLERIPDDRDEDLFFIDPMKSESSDPKPGQRSGTGRSVNVRSPETQTIEDFFPTTETDLVPIQDIEMELHESEQSDNDPIRGQISYQPEPMYLDLNKIEKKSDELQQRLAFIYLSNMFCRHGPADSEEFREKVADKDLSDMTTGEAMEMAAEELGIDFEEFCNELDIEMDEAHSFMEEE